MTLPSIPIALLKTHSAHLTADVLLNGLRRGLIFAGDIPVLARTVLGDEFSELRALFPGERVAPLLEVSAGGGSEERSGRLFAFLSLTHALETCPSNSDILDVVEQVYSSLDYPEALAPFVRYMPATGPSYGSREESEAAMVERLRSFATNERGHFSDATSD